MSRAVVVVSLSLSCCVIAACAPDVDDDDDGCVAGADGFSDPGFDDADAWDVEAGAVDEAAGVLVFDDVDDICARAAAASAVVDVPPACAGARLSLRRELAVPLVEPWVVRLGDRVVDVVADSGGVCLGDAVLGRQLPARVQPALDSCLVAQPERLTGVSVQPDATCPASGTVAPYDGDNLWIVRPGRNGVFDLTADALELTTAGCDSASAEGPAQGTVSIPDRAGLALRVVVDGVLRDDGVFGPPLLLHAARASWALGLGENRLCVPDGLRGTVPALQLQLIAGDADCDVAPAQRARFGRIEVVDDEGCAAGHFVDPPEPRLNAATTVDGVLHLRPTTLCADALGIAQLTVPAPGPDGGPIVRFRYRHATDNGRFIVSIAPFTFGEAITPNLDGGAYSRCVPPERQGEVGAVRFFLPAAGVTFCEAGIDPPIDVSIFDVEVSLDPACPSST